jgi:hypothetical protein
VVLFDLLQQRNTPLLRAPLSFRREALEELFADQQLTAPWALCPQTRDRDQALEWLRTWPEAGAAEGIVVKGLGQRYEPGRRAWWKLRARHTAEAVVGGVTGPVDSPAGCFWAAGTLPEGSVWSPGPRLCRRPPAGSWGPSSHLQDPGTLGTGLPVAEEVLRLAGLLAVLPFHCDCDRRVGRTGLAAGLVRGERLAVAGRRGLLNLAEAG